MIPIKHPFRLCGVIIVLIAAMPKAMATLPFLTDSAVPTAYKAFDIYFYSTFDKENIGKNFQIPALELDWGFAPNFEVDFNVPYIGFIPENNRSNNQEVWGIGDLTTTVRYSIVNETEHRPQIAFAPSYVWSTGKNNNAFFSNPRHSIGLPILLQKTWENWTTSAEAGYFISKGSNNKNFPIAGCLVSHKLDENLSLGAELFYVGPYGNDSHDTGLFNAGAIYTLHKNIDLSFGIGHSIFGDNTLITSLGMHLALD
jgi:hypothetical protein